MRETGWTQGRGVKSPEQTASGGVRQQNREGDELPGSIRGNIVMEDKGGITLLVEAIYSYRLCGTVENRKIQLGNAAREGVANDDRGE
ncbi:MAG: hypothetical protein ACR2HH_11185 [Chthoniobacterales bacterium]